MIFEFTYFIDSAMGWSGPNRVTRTVLSPTWDPNAMTRVAGRVTSSGDVSGAASAREDAAPPPAMT